ncbi:MAG TPA: hypothetical protein VGL69_11375 [Solirubrobacteraceae bacterium]|jgi:uncharacterized protein YukE
MADPLTDPRAAQLLATSPDEIDSLAGFFQTVSGQAEQASTGLQGAHGDETWTGGAADAFRAKLGKLPGDLSTVQSSYADAAQALRTYATNVAPIKSQFQSLAQQLQSAQGQLTSAQGTLSNAQGSLTSAQSNLTTTQNAPKAKPSDPAVTTAKGAVSTAQTNVSSAQGAVNRLSGEVSGLSSHGCQLLDEFDTVRGHCRSAIDGAGSKAPQHHSSFFGSLVSIGDDIVKGVAGVATNLWKHIKDLPAAAVNLWEHPSWDALGRFAEDVGAAATVVALAATVVVAPEALLAGGAEEAAAGAAEGGVAAAEEGGAAAAEEGAAGAAEEGASGAGEEEAETAGSKFMSGAKAVQSYSSGVATRAGVASTVSEAAQGNYRAALIDGAFSAASLGDGAASLLRPEDAAAANEAGETLSSMQSYQEYRNLGYSDQMSKDLAFEDGNVPEGLAGSNPSSETITAALKEQTEALETAKAPIEDLGHFIDTLGVDPLKDKLKDAVGAGS